METLECERVPCPPKGAPRWIVTFADLMALLVCFFVLLLSFSEIEATKFKEIAGSMERAFGIQNKIPSLDSPKGISIIAQEFSPGKPEPTPINVIKQTTTTEAPNLTQTIDEYDKKGDGSLEKEKQAQIDSIIAEMSARGGESEISAEKINEAIAEATVKSRQESISQQYAKLLNQRLETEITDGLISVETKDENIIIRIKDKGSFISGDATMRDDFYVTMERITEEIAHTPGRITIAGHTDNIPIKTSRFRSNWELSSSRAVSVLQYMLSSGLFNPTNLQVNGFADTQPLVPNNSAENRATNRRIEITITPAIKPLF